MKEVLLVGPETPFLRILATVLSHAWPVGLACDEASLEEVLAGNQPAVVVFNHMDPMDLFALNPRRFGFGGPILLLADEPVLAGQLLETDVRLQRPSDLVMLSRLIGELIGEPND